MKTNMISEKEVRKVGTGVNIIELQVEMLRHGKTNQDMIIETGISHVTWYRKKNRELKYTREDIVAICRVLGIKDNRLIEIFFPDL